MNKKERAELAEFLKEKRTALDLANDLSLLVQVRGGQNLYWDSEKLVYQRTRALVEAINVGYTVEQLTDTSYFHSEEEFFTTPERRAKYEQLLKSLKTEYGVSRRRSITIEEMGFLYATLFHCKLRLDRAKNSMPILFSELSFSQLVATRLLDEVFQKAEEFDKLIALVLDPEEREFQVSELVEKYNYPYPSSIAYYMKESKEK